MEREMGLFEPYIVILASHLGVSVDGMEYVCLCTSQY